MPPNPLVVSRWTARIMPAVVLGIIGYVSYAFIAQICVKYLLDKPSAQRKTSRAVGTIVGFCILLLLMLLPYGRILHTLASDPGYAPRNRKIKRVESNTEKAVGSEPLTGIPYEKSVESRTSRPAPEDPQPGLEYFYNKDVFVCEGDGRPTWCTRCAIFKPDRAHHCSDVDRCVRKMDHFCPWVGGIVSETNFKFFFQFVTWTWLFCTYVLIVTAVSLAEYRRSNSGVPNAHWIVVIALAGAFLFFTAGMTITTGKNILFNSTSVEELSRTVKKWSLAVYLPNPPAPTQPRNYQMVTFPTESRESGSTRSRTFAILYSQAGENPFDLGKYNNFTSVMGDSIWQWMFPLKRSPCSNHKSKECDWPLGPVYDRMREEAGLGRR